MKRVWGREWQANHSKCTGAQSREPQLLNQHQHQHHWIKCLLPGMTVPSWGPAHTVHTSMPHPTPPAPAHPPVNTLSSFPPPAASPQHSTPAPSPLPSHSLPPLPKSTPLPTLPTPPHPHTPVDTLSSSPTSCVTYFWLELCTRGPPTAAAGPPRDPGAAPDTVLAVDPDPPLAASEGTPGRPRGPARDGESKPLPPAPPGPEGMRLCGARGDPEVGEAEERAAAAASRWAAAAGPGPEEAPRRGGCDSKGVGSWRWLREGQ